MSITLILEVTDSYSDRVPGSLHTGECHNETYGCIIPLSYRFISLKLLTVSHSDLVISK